MADNLIVKERVLDFSDCAYLGEIYEVIKKELELPEWCGSNLDALWDAVTGIMYTPVEITIKTEIRRAELRQSVEDVVSVLRDAEREYGEIIVVVER